MRSCFWSLAFLGLALVSPPSAAALDRPAFRHITSDDGLSARYVKAILQDHLGFLWFGTAEGLNRYDGYQITVYRAAPGDPQGLTNGAVNVLLEDRKNRLWIGTANGLNRLDPETGVFQQYPGPRNGSEDDRFGRIQALLTDADGGLWIGSLDGLFQMDIDSGAARRFRSDPADPASLSGERVFCLEADSRGGIWVGTANGLNRFDPRTGQFTRYLHNPGDPQSISSPEVRALLWEEEGLWIGADGGGLSRLDYQTGRFRHFRHDPGDPRSLSSDLVRFIHRDQSGNLWVGTVGGGLNRWNPRTEGFGAILSRQGSPDGLASNHLISMAEDLAGNLWFGTMDAGVSRMDPIQGRFRLYRPGAAHPGLVDRQIVGFAEDREGNLLVATRGGELIRFRPGTEQFEPVRPGGRPISGASLFPLLVDSRGIYWAGTWGDGLIAYDPSTGQKTRYRHDPADPFSIGHNLVAAIQEGPEGNIWVGTWGGGLHRLDVAGREGSAVREKSARLEGSSGLDGIRGRFHRFRHDPDDPRSLADDRVLDLLFDRNGELWISVVGRGIDRRLPGETGFRHVPPDQFGAGDTVNTFFEDREGRLWVGTNRGFCEREANGKFECLTVSDGLPNNEVQGILQDGAGKLWLGTSGGLSRFDPETREFRNFDRRDGLQANDFNIRSAAKSRDGILYFGGNGGLNAFRPETIRDNPYVPPVALTELRVFNQPVAPGKDSPLKRPIHVAGEIVLQPDQSVFSIEFTAFNFSIPEKNRYAYRMSGVDPDWVHVGADRRFATYTNLAPGDYRFEVRGSNNDGVWNEKGTSIRVRVLPPWWATLWFRGGILLLFVGLLGGGYQWRVREIRGRNRELAAEVARRTRNLESVNRHLWDSMAAQERTAEALRESEERFRIAFENASVAICLVDLTGRITRVNRRMCEIYGYRDEELTGMTVNDISYPEDVDKSPEFIRKALAGEVTVAEFEKRYLRKTGEIIWGRVISSLARDPLDRPLYFISHIEDITERKAAADALRASHERFATVMDGIRGLMYVSDMDTHEVLFANRALREEFGEVEGKVCWQALQEGQDGPCGFCTNSQLLDEAGRPSGIVHWDFQNSRNRHWYQVEDQAIPWVDGRMVRMCFATDITDLKRAEAEIKRARDAAEAANQAKSHFLASLSHEIRTPMNAILGFGDLLLSQETDPQKQTQLKTLRDSGQALLNLLNELLDLSRIEAGRFELRPEPTRLPELLEEIHRLFRPEAERKGLSLTAETAVAPAGPVLLDPVRLRQILVNLVGNALKFTDSGEVRLETQLRERGPDRLDLLLVVSDTGTGIPAASLAEIFDPFTQAHGRDRDCGKSRAKGAGLGLAICRQLAERMGGGLMVASVEGGGSAFRLSLPGVPVLPEMKSAREPAPGEIPASRKAAEPVAPPPAAGDSPLGKQLWTLWRKASVKQFMPDIQAFANTIRAAGEPRRPDLVEYAETLSAAVRDYDVAEIMSLLERFPARLGAVPETPMDGETAIPAHAKEPHP
jgi:PAS domain S-box-containing protein